MEKLTPGVRVASVFSLFYTAVLVVGALWTQMGSPSTNWILLVATCTFVSAAAHAFYAFVVVSSLWSSTRDDVINTIECSALTVSFSMINVMLVLLNHRLVAAYFIAGSLLVLWFVRIVAYPKPQAVD